MAKWFSWRKSEPALEGETSEVDELQLDVPVLEAPPETPSEPLEPSPEEEPVRGRSIWQRGLARLRRVFSTPLGQLFRRRPLSEEVFAELEEALLGADVGVQTTTDLIERLRERCRHEKPEDASALRGYLKEEMLVLLQKLPNPPLVGDAKPWVILMVGVNGVGKTTSIAKLATRFHREGKKYCSLLLILSARRQSSNSKYGPSVLGSN